MKESLTYNYWRILLYLMFFFSFSYFIAIVLILSSLEGYILGLTGIVFLFGALFVYIVTKVGYYSMFDLKTQINKSTEKLKNKNKDLQENNIKTRAILEAIPDIMFILDQNGNCLEIKLSTQKETHLIKPFFEGKNIYKIELEDETENYFLVSQRILHTHYLAKKKEFSKERLITLEYQLNFRGRTYDFEARCILIRRKNILCIVRNVTEVKNLHRKLVQKKNEAIQEAKIKANFLANMSHEIRTPLNGVLGMTDLLLDDGNCTNRQRDYLRLIQNSGITLLYLINDILDFSKIQAGEMAIEKIPFQLIPTVKNVLKPLELIASPKKIKFVLEIQRDFNPTLKGDPHRLKQILTNLINNAIKFTESGSIKIQIEIVHECLGNEKSITLRFCVIDSGIGIPKKNQERIFKEFVQSDMSTTRKYGGTGLGLSICKKLTKLMKGKIGLESPVYDDPKFPGTMFWIEIPFKQMESSFEKFSSQNLVEPKKIRVCFFSMKEFFPKKLLEYCKIIGYKTFFSFELEKVKKYKPGIVLIDINFRKEGGLQLINGIREVLPHTKIAVFTDTGMPGDAKIVSRAGGDAYLSLPIDLRSFKTILELLIQQTNPSEKALITKHSVHEMNTLPDPKLNVLVVEDNEVNQLLIKTMLEKNNCLVDVASDGNQGIDSARRKEYDLIFMDLTMPDKDGYQATTEIRQFNQKVPIIAVTAHALPKYKNKCLTAGMNEILLKPFQLKDLEKVLSDWKPQSYR